MSNSSIQYTIYGKTEQSAIGRVAEYGARVDTEWQCSSEPTACSGHHQIRVTDRTNDAATGYWLWLWVTWVTRNYSTLVRLSCSDISSTLSVSATLACPSASSCA